MSNNNNHSDICLAALRGDGQSVWMEGVNLPNPIRLDSEALVP